MSRVRISRPARLPFLALCLALVACQAPLPRASATPTPTTSSNGVDRRVAAADAKLFAGNYDGAEADYRSLASANVPGAASHLSTLLAYENRFEEAINEAQTGVALKADSDSLARLTRALDWGQDIDGAVAAGAKAVASKPVEPLAYAFYSEALADAGRFDEARKALYTAEGMGGDAYAQAEIDREWGNYYRAHGDSESDLNYMELSVRAQPKFPERQLDLIRYDYGNQRQDTAGALTDKLLAATGKNYRIVVAAADAALIGGDLNRAPALYNAAAGIQPGGAEAALGLAEIDVALQRDFNGAHDVLLNALKGNPTSSGLYEYLRYLDLLVLKKDPAAELDPITPQRPAALAADRKAALDAVNAARSADGLPALTEDPALDEAAQAHTYFYLFNVSQSQVSGSGIVMEDPSLPGFTGARAVDRARHFGFTGARGTELADHALTPGASSQDFIDSVFHRLPLVDRETVSAGFGEARVGSIVVSMLDVGAGPAGTGDPTVYPADGQSGVPAAFVDNEIPDPLPQGSIPPVGYPVSLQVGGAQQLKVTTGRLLGPDGRQVPVITFDPGNQVLQNQWAMVARQPLTPGTRYTADVTGTVNGADFSRRWSFTVAGP
jgi:Cysteine-rich secretory protein family